MAEQAKRRFFSGIGKMVGISVVPETPAAAQDVMTAQTVDKTAPTLGEVQTTVMPDGPNAGSTPVSLGSKVESSVAAGTMMGSVDTHSTPPVVPDVPMTPVMPDNPAAPSDRSQEPVIVPAERQVENAVQAPPPITPEEPAAPTVPDAPAAPVAEVVKPAPIEMPEAPSAPTFPEVPAAPASELTGVEVPPVAPRIESQAPEMHAPEFVTPKDSADVQEPEAPADVEPEQEETSEPEVRIDPIATSIFLESADKIIKDGVVDMEAYKKAREAYTRSENLVKQLKSLGVDPKAIDEHLAEWLEEKLAA